MRFDRLVIEGYGRLHALDTGPAPLGNLVAVQGDNETGKSTLFHCLTTLLFGFEPASRERHPYNPWDGRPLACAADVHLDDGTALRLERRLLSRPQGGLERASLREELANRPVPWAQPLGREAFQSVYAITTEQLAELHGSTWELIQERLLTGLGAPDLGSVTRAIATLEDEANRCWRPDRRGKPLATQARAKVASLRQRVCAAQVRDERQRALEARRGACQQELEHLRLALEELAARQARLAAQRARHATLAQAQAEAASNGAGPGMQDGEQDLPHDAATQLTSLDRAAEEHGRECERLAARRQELLAAERVTDVHDPAWLAARDELRALADELAHAQRLEPTRREAAALAAQVATQHAELWRQLGVPPVALGAARRSGLTAEALGAWVAEYERHAARVRQVQPTSHDGIDVMPAQGASCATTARTEQRASSGSGHARRSTRLPTESRALPAARQTGFPWLALALALVGCSLIVYASLFVSERWWGLVGLTLALIGGALLLRTVRERMRQAMASHAAHRAAEQEAREVAQLATESGALCARLAELVAPLELPPSASTLQFGVALAGRWETLLTLEARHEAARHAATEAAAESERLAARHATLVARCGALPGTAAELRSALEAVVQRQARAAQAREERQHRERELTRATQAHSAARSARADLAARLATLGDGSVDRGLIVLEARRAARRRVADLMRELAQTAPDDLPGDQRPDPSANLTAALSARAEALDAALAAVAAERAVLGARHAALNQELGSLERERTQLEREDSVEDLASALADEIARFDALLRRRDRALLLARLLASAERRFRDAHQPDVVRHASRYLRTITGARHAELLVQNGEHGIEFLLRRQSGETVKVQRPLSRGLRDQIFLALRLAIADHLDSETERMPLLIDESLVNWDPHRRRQGIALLREISTRRQVFFFSFEPASYGLTPDLVLGNEADGAYPTPAP